MLKEIKRGMMIAGSVALLFSASACGGDEPTGSQNQTVKCAGINSCKGQGACAGQGHECTGLNDCQGKGYLEVADAEACAKAGGTVI
jgi:hypothetical protein